MNKLHGKSVLLGMGIGIILTALLGLIFTLGYSPQTARPRGGEQINQSGGTLRLEITKEDTLTEITEKLTELKLVENAVTFQIKIVSRKIQDQIIPGTYEFQGNEDEEEVLKILTSRKE